MTIPRRGLKRSQVSVRVTVSKDSNAVGLTTGFDLAQQRCTHSVINWIAVSQLSLTVPATADCRFWRQLYRADRPRLSTARFRRAGSSATAGSRSGRRRS